ncbi:MAG: hypothetical protein KJO34_04315 [Deltaproteobacteria bacterium]|nr:hypothetical protein [Deltaproteobacteria bacterium]
MRGWGGKHLGGMNLHGYLPRRGKTAGNGNRGRVEPHQSLYKFGQVGILSGMLEKSIDYNQIQQLRGAFNGCSLFKIRDLCKTPLFTQFLRQAQILILEILNVFLWLKFSPSLHLSKNEHFSKVSIQSALRIIKRYLATLF